MRHRRLIRELRRERRHVHGLTLVHQHTYVVVARGRLKRMLRCLPCIMIYSQSIYRVPGESELVSSSPTFIVAQKNPPRPPVSKVFVGIFAICENGSGYIHVEVAAATNVVSGSPAATMAHVPRKRGACASSSRHSPLPPAPLPP